MTLSNARLKALLVLIREGKIQPDNIVNDEYKAEVKRIEDERKKLDSDS